MAPEDQHGGYRHPTLHSTPVLLQLLRHSRKATRLTELTTENLVGHENSEPPRGSCKAVCLQPQKIWLGTRKGCCRAVCLQPQKIWLGTASTVKRCPKPLEIQHGIVTITKAVEQQ